MESKLTQAKLVLLQKKGQSGVNSKVATLVGALIVIVILASLAPTFFTGVGSRTGLGNATLNPDSPTWLPTVLIIIIATGLVFVAFKAFGGK